MKKQRASLRVLFGSCVVAAVAAIAHPVLAQQNRPQPRPLPTERNAGDLRRDRNERLVRAEDLRRREWELRSIENVSRRPPESPFPRLAYAQIREDFVRLQVVNNEMMRATFDDPAPATPNYRQIAKATGEIRRRAGRLKSNLTLPEPERSERPQAVAEITTVEQLKASLLELDRLIMSFVSNPIFKNPNVVDAQQGLKARLDLEAIIALSERIKKSAERFGA